MVTVHFLGRVLLGAVQVSIGHKPNISWEEPEIGLKMLFTVHIEKSAIDVTCQLNRYEPKDFGEIYRRALDLTKASVNLFSFKTGYGLEAVLETFVDWQGATSLICPTSPDAAELCTAYDLDSGFEEVHKIALTNIGFYMALNDLVEAIRIPHVASVNCARAIERIRHQIASPNASDSEAWKQMREALHIDRPFLQMITDISRAPRHGGRGYIPGTVTAETLRRSWLIMNRYIEFLKRGNQLPQDDFPLLQEPAT